MIVWGTGFYSLRDNRTWIASASHWGFPLSGEPVPTHHGLRDGVATESQWASNEVCRIGTPRG